MDCIRVEVEGRTYDVQREPDGTWRWPAGLKTRIVRPSTVAANVLAHGTGALNVDGCRIGDSKRVPGGQPRGPQDRIFGAYGAQDGSESGHDPEIGRWPSNVVLGHSPGCVRTGTKRVPTSMGVRGSAEGGVAFVKPKATHEVVGYADADGMETVEAWDCEPGCAVRLLDEQSGESASRADLRRAKHDNAGIVDYGGNAGPQPPRMGYADTGGASRFFYTAKASTSEREDGLDDLPRALAHDLVDRAEDSAGLDSPRAGAGRTSEGRANIHPTVKPVSLMRWLVRLVTPPGGLVVDPFMGSGTTGVAAILEGMRFVGVDLDTAHACIAWHRCENARAVALEEAAAAKGEA